MRRRRKKVVDAGGGGGGGGEDDVVGEGGSGGEGGGGGGAGGGRGLLGRGSLRCRRLRRIVLKNISVYVYVKMQDLTLFIYGYFLPSA